MPDNNCVQLQIKNYIFYNMYYVQILEMNMDKKQQGQFVKLSSNENF